MEFIQNMGWFPMPEFPCPLLLVRFVPQDENYKKKGRAIKLLQPFPAQPSSHFFLSGLFLKMKTTKRREGGIQAVTAISSPTQFPLHA
jgi:hypothetical protein